MENQINGEIKAKKREMTNKFLQNLRQVLDKYFNSFPQSEELTKFMQDESRLYDKEGKITPEYEEWISRFEKYSKENPITVERDELSENQKAILEGAIEYFSLRHDSMEAYEKANNLDEWLEKELPESDQKEAFKKLIKEELEGAVKDLNKNEK